MSQLFFKHRFHAAIRDGSKRTTIRRWARPRVVAGRNAYVLGIGWLHIEKVELIDWASLDEADARADGFASRAQMLSALNEFYPNAAGGNWFRVTFDSLRPQPK